MYITGNDSCKLTEKKWNKSYFLFVIISTSLLISVFAICFNVGPISLFTHKSITSFIVAPHLYFPSLFLYLQLMSVYVCVAYNALHSFYHTTEYREERKPEALWNWRRELRLDEGSGRGRKRQSDYRMRSRGMKGMIDERREEERWWGHLVCVRKRGERKTTKWMERLEERQRAPLDFVLCLLPCLTSFSLSHRHTHTSCCLIMHSLFIDTHTHTQIFFLQMPFHGLLSHGN